MCKQRKNWVRSNMDVVDDSLDDRLTVLQTALARTNGIPKLALDYRVDRLHLPTLPIHSVQPSLRHQIGTRSSGAVNQFTSTSNGWDDVCLPSSLAVETSVRYRYPLPTSTFTLPSVASIPTSTPTQSHEVAGIIARASSCAPCHYQLRVSTHRVPTEYPPFIQYRKVRPLLVW